MKTLGIIPARYASTRLPGKPLVHIGGKPMIQRVYEQAQQCDAIDQLIVATDDARIVEAVRAFGGEVELTREDHPSGTDRIAEVAGRHPTYDIVVNIQGDEPFIDPQVLQQLIAVFNVPDVDIATLVRPLTDIAALDNPNMVKAVIGQGNRALYFSRSPVPYLRDVPRTQWLDQEVHFQHLGVYAYRTKILATLTNLPKSGLEQAESLEQLRWLEAGYQIAVSRTTHVSVGVDTPEDITRAEAYLKSNPDR